MHGLIKYYLAHIPQPAYLCPVCRSPIQTKPMEVYVVKEVVRGLTVAYGEEEDVGGLHVSSGVVWEGYFAPVSS